MNEMKRRGAALAGVVAITLVAAACGGDNSSNSSSASTGVSTTAASGASTSAASASDVSIPKDLQATLNASGATFPKAFYDEAISAFSDAYSGITINYGGGGSGKGRQDLADMLVDWAGSDAPVKAEDVPKYKGGALLYFPTIVAPITVSYNVKGVDELQLSPDTIAKIFQRQITTWNDAAIAADNPGATLPATAITVAHRSDGSGTTENFTKFLDAASGASASGVWTLKSGATVEWPTDTQAGNGNAGVAQVITGTDGAIGYVDLSDAKASNLKFASVKNKAGKFVEPTLDATSAAVEGVKVNPDLTFFAGWADGDQSYPIAAQTWILAYTKQSDNAKGQALQGFLSYIYGDGQNLAQEVDFAALPDSLLQKAKAQISQLQLPA
jgi:phosphate transport system substrate-binding protein